ncbi:BolA family transcriptional regulator [Azonexus hydrophilus]|uniref:BolA family transcriptional regulator n=1 Tax=Azonexus hydrophilus TaxID=418702 RepID=A0A1R1I150_9RHOO|nr:BolA family protein [Azonexus hydrophilus]OMG52457.1 BolA family transcriptional regulator [Azonexus hydrophilus]
MHAATIDLLRERLAVLSPLALTIEDESHRHAGHAGARDGGHFKLDIVATAFAGKSTLARHRLVYDAAGDLMRGRIHALAIRAQAPEEI